ncbi:cleavage induced protein kinase [Thraustotheca clavata]|uniref:Cleavage induced protein kinase n=1 Tax=Thraustotheca clavata TaxID=74557 RepID=A0A1V9ZBR6_9STRA|nr:cleavage induced protein kinase [Thraustotheca clavata]
MVPLARLTRSWHSLRVQTLRLQSPRASFWTSATVTSSIKMAIAGMTALGMGSIVSPTQNRSSQWMLCDEEIGTGAFGVVRIGVSKTTGEKAAIKTMRVQSKTHKAIEREVDTLLRIQSLGGHKNIIALKDVFVEQNQVCVVTEFVGGGELFQHLLHYGAFNEVEARRMLYDIAQAVLFLHSNGLIHKDIKPENVLLCYKEKRADNEAKLADFGSAGPQSPFNRLDDIGTSVYLAPELLNAKDGAVWTQAADMWAIGCILYILLTGMHPFDMEGNVPEEVIEKRIQRAKVCFSHPNCDNLSANAKDLIVGLLQKDPNQRLSIDDLLNHPWMSQQHHTNPLYPISLFHPKPN